MFGKKIQISEDLNGIIVKCNVAAALGWNGHSETWNKEAELNILWIWEKMDWQAWVENWKKQLLDFIGKNKKWVVWKGAQAGFESLDLKTEGIGKEKLLRFVEETKMEDLGVVEILGFEIFWVTKRTMWRWICEKTISKWLRIKTGFLNHSITRIWQ